MPTSLRRSAADTHGTKLLLFDIDGTLLDTKGAGRRAMERVAAELFGNGFSFDAVSFGGNLDPCIFREAAAANGLAGDHDEAHDAFHARYVPALRAELQACAAGDFACEALVGVHDALAVCRAWVDEGVAALGCLTGNYTKAVPVKLGHVGIDPDQFTVTAFADEASTRPGLVEVAMRKHVNGSARPIDPRDVIVIGDTKRDVDCAKAHGCVAYAVCTGAGTRDELVAAGADVVVDDLSDLSPLRAIVQG